MARVPVTRFRSATVPPLQRDKTNWKGKHPMKTILTISILFSVIALPALGELTKADLNEIRLIVKDEVKSEITASEKRMTEHINTKIESVDKRLSLVTTLVVALIALIVLAVGIPQILMALRSRRDASLEKQVETLTKEIETLKQKQIVRP